MQLLSIDNLGKTLGGKRLFEGVSFGIESGQKTAVIGINGSGKSTLLAVLAGLDSDFEGMVARNRALSVGVLPQLPVFDPASTILEYVLSGDDPRAILLREYEWCLAEMQKKDTPALQTRLADLMHRVEESGAWEYENRFSSILTELNIPDTSLKMGELSGGMARKVDLARVLVAEADLLLLDEPTNHLDIPTILWLQQYLERSSQALLLVTHDRYFLDAVCGRILEIEDGKLYSYEGNYSFYMEKKSEREAAAVQEQEKLRNVLRRELAWLRRGAKARTTKQKARIQRADDLADRVTKDGPDSAGFEVGHRRLGKTILEMEAVAKSYDDRPVIASFSHVFKKGERLGLLGPNGSGKTTLLNLMTGSITPDDGTVKPGVNTKFGVFDQTPLAMDPETRVLDYLKEEAENIRRTDGSVLSSAQLLEAFLFPRRMFSEPIGKLSGGERRRLQLIRVLLPDPNFIILDEPTNDFDIRTLSMLEEFLLEFPGCVAVVSHDRYFLDRTVDSLLVFDGEGGVASYPGSCSEYLESRAASRATDTAEKKKKPEQEQPQAAPEKKKLTYAERLEFDALMGEIEALEGERSALEALLSGGETDPEKISEAAAEHAKLTSSIEGKTSRWELLAERAE